MADIFPPLTPHYNDRKPVMIIIHGIGTTLEEAERTFTGKSSYEVSTHYLITQSGEVRQYLDELTRAWQAGQSYWSGITDINSIAIGIEMESKPVITDDKDFYLTSYTDAQMTALAPMLKRMCEDYKIAPEHILPHQDIAPYRKYDPGPNFDWAYLARNAIGLWHDLEPVTNDSMITDQAVIDTFIRDLFHFGYDPRLNADGKDMSWLIRAFQTHYLPWHICGQVTAQSVAALDILLDKKYLLF